MKVFKTILKTLSVCLMLFCGVSLALPKPPIDQCPVSNSYPNPPSANDYCHCFQSQAITNCGRIRGSGDPLCNPKNWEELKRAIWTYSATQLCERQLKVFDFKGNHQNYETYLNNCINETNYFKTLDNQVCQTEV